ncbi:MAG: hypothetical protein ACD_28C00278G0004 [uncultured bacterium]|nr:MAG: hypothetical protein ACD_28C00278G0004 [uncultured bacterium]KKT76144.1 MAG: hypothetical protein UW70_C0021G0011 [Candidatus Peregrinibacteria bacterium GW2011_GWA2_44_7]
MNGEIFSGAEGNEGGGISPDKVREFQARMAQNQQLMAAARQQEQRQKQNEDKLVAILLKFIQNSKKSDLTLLIARCLEQNIPAVFILALILLGNEDVQKELGVHFELGNEPLALAGSTEENHQQTLHDIEDPEMSGALVVFGQDRSFPIKLRLAVDLWGKNIFDAASPIPERILKTVPEYNEDPEAVPISKEMVTQLTAFVLRDYFAQNHFTPPYENLKNFADFFMRGVLKRVKDQIENQKQLG